LAINIIVNCKVTYITSVNTNRINYKDLVEELVKDGVVKFKRIQQANRRLIMKPDKYAYSFDEETYQGAFDSVDEALKEVYNEYEYDKVYVGKLVDIDPSKYIFTDKLLEIIDEGIYDDIGDVNEPFFVIDNNTFEKDIEAVIRKHVIVTAKAIADSKKYNN